MCIRDRSRTNELALASHGYQFRRGIIGGALTRSTSPNVQSPEILQRVPFADWSPEGVLAVVHGVGGHTLVEYPIGTVLYDTTGWISDLRFSPDGEKLAFMDHPVYPDDRGNISVIDLKGNRTVLSSGWKAEGGLAWAPRGNEIWFTASNQSGETKGLWAVDLRGTARQILTLPGSFFLQDIGRDGSVLITVDEERSVMELSSADGKTKTDLSWYEGSVPKDISRDGMSVLFDETGFESGPHYITAIRKVDGSPPVRLGEGTAGGFSPDGKWVVSVFPNSPQYLSLIPVGAGTERRISLPLEHIVNGGAHFSADGTKLLVRGNLAGHPPRDFRVDLSEENPSPQPITPEDQSSAFPSPDGRYLLKTIGRTGALALVPTEGGPAQPLPLSQHFNVLRWSSDSKSLYLFPETAQIPLKIYRMELATRKLSFITQLTPATQAGVLRISSVVAAPDLSKFAYSYRQISSSLYLVTGLR